MSECIAHRPSRRARGALAIAAAACVASAFAVATSPASAEPSFPYMPKGASEGFVVTKASSVNYGPAGCNATRSVIYCWGDDVRKPSAAATRKCLAEGTGPAVIWRLTRTGKATRGYVCVGGVMGISDRYPGNRFRPRSLILIGSFVCKSGRSARGPKWRTITCTNAAMRKLTYQSKIDS